MIYRILCGTLVPGARGFDWEVYPDRGLVVYRHGRLKGAYMAGVDGFTLKAPRIDNPRARFYFTERGWREVGLEVAANARREGRVVRVIRRKNPDDSQVVYRDELQLAILPRRDALGR